MNWFLKMRLRVAAADEAAGGLIGNGPVVAVGSAVAIEIIAVASGQGRRFRVNRESHEIGEIQDADAARTQAENKLPLLEQRVNPGQSPDWKAGHELHAQTGPQAADSFGVEENWSRAVRVGVSRERLEAREEFALGHFHQRAEREWKIPNRQVLGDKINARDERRQKCDVILSVGDVDEVLAEERAGMKFGPVMITEFRILRNQRANGAIDLADPDFEVR